MAWDPALLKKFTSVGHFRLLNQLRSELKDNPLPRRDARSGRGPQGPAGGTGRSRRSRGSRRAAAAPEPSPQSESQSFRDRLNAIDMR
ncbi:hypothetical protein EVJ50_05325 [Synechococcus sp. RSCCF101]|uniref:hypothetical protein n=1 Tax=Synechococcus sp. RSCCF101 TaxID=2511069 RepID=UPI001243C5D4|nr:hypothetical protein [Synechococcus sp. RSCCF101]QEY31753.1 hypothetical protein EVJ50_05325 [Synechococcus sp. RSCCF101]